MGPTSNIKDLAKGLGFSAINWPRVSFHCGLTPPLTTAMVRPCKHEQNNGIQSTRSSTHINVMLWGKTHNSPNCSDLAAKWLAHVVPVTRKISGGNVAYRTMCPNTEFPPTNLCAEITHICKVVCVQYFDDKETDATVFCGDAAHTLHVHLHTRAGQK